MAGLVAGEWSNEVVAVLDVWRATMDFRLTARDRAGNSADAALSVRVNPLVPVLDWTHSGERLPVFLPHRPEYELASGTLVLFVDVGDVATPQGIWSKDHLGIGTGGHLGVRVADGQVDVRSQAANGMHTTLALPIAPGRRYIRVDFGAGGFRLIVHNRVVSAPEWTQGIAENREWVVVGARSAHVSPGTTDDIRDPFKGAIEGVRLYPAGAPIPPQPPSNVRAVPGYEEVA